MATQKFDVAVIGAGIFGLSVAFAAARRRLSVVVLEARTAGSGASGGPVGALSPHVPEQWNDKKAYQLKALLAAEPYWQEIAALSGQATGYRRAGRVIPILSAEELARAQERARSAATLWEGAANWCVKSGPPPLLSPQSAPSGYVQESLSARIFPPQAMAALAAACKAERVEIREECSVSEIINGQICGPWGQLRAEAAVLAAGVEGFSLLASVIGETPGKGVKGQAAILQAPCRGDEPMIYHDGLYVVPHGPGRVAVGSTSENEWQKPCSTDEKLDQVIARAEAFCPMLKGAPVVHRWAGLRPKARRRDPMLGAIPGAPGLFAALGGFKIGFGLAPEVGETLADLITGQPTFLPESFTPSHHLRKDT